MIRQNDIIVKNMDFGVRESSVEDLTACIALDKLKTSQNLFTSIKIELVIIHILKGCCLFQRKNVLFTYCSAWCLYVF